MMKRGMRNLLGMGLLAAMLLPAGAMVMADEPLVPPASAAEYDLMAGQDWVVGSVRVWNDVENLYVLYSLDQDVVDEGWAMSEVHLEVGCSRADFPLNKSGNPQVGKFTYGGALDPLATEWLETISLEDVGCSSVLIAAHAVVTDAPKGQMTGTIYGTRTTGGTLGLYEIDVVNGTATLLKALSSTLLGNGTGYSNALAYDPESNVLYFTAPRAVNVTPSPFWSYDVDSNGLVMLGNLTGSVVGASFHDGAYYYIAETTNDLLKVDDFTGLVPELVLSGFGSPSDFTFGDVAISEVGVLYGSTRTAPQRFFSLELGSGTYDVVEGSNALDLQLAYGSNGVLYGVNHATGKFYSVDEATGVATLLPFTMKGLADLASGTPFVPQSETAWAEGTRFADKGSWATYFTYCVKEWVLLETLSIQASSAMPVTSSEVLESGEVYLLKASGTASAGDSIEFDAKYSLTARIPGDTWTDSVSGYLSYGPALLDLFVDDASIDWGAYNESHAYEHVMDGAGAPIELLINDIYYPNNAGSLVVELYGWRCPD